MKTSAQQGFTLMEAILVITILGILGTIAVSTLTDSSERGREKALTTAAAEIQGRINTQFMRYTNAGNSCPDAVDKVSNLKKLADRTDGSDACFGQFCVKSDSNVTATGTVVEIRFADQKTYYTVTDFKLTVPSCSGDFQGTEPKAPKPSDPDGTVSSGYEAVEPVVNPYSPVKFNAADASGKNFSEVLKKGNIVSEDGNLYVVTATDDTEIKASDSASDAKYSHLLKKVSTTRYFVWHEEGTKSQWRDGNKPGAGSLCVVENSSGEIQYDLVWVWVGSGSPSWGPPSGTTTGSNSGWIRVTESSPWPGSIV